MKRGTRKFKCDECGHEQMLHWTERSRRSRPRCTNCGSQWLDPVTKEGCADVKQEGQNLKDPLQPSRVVASGWKPSQRT